MKELIKKYKIEFNHWLNDGVLLYKTIYSSEPEVWHLFDGNWNYTPKEIKIVLNDEYVELRKAFVDGKTIQLYCDIEDDWFDCNDLIKSNDFLCNVSAYRIKPDESEFKEGDWITFTTSLGTERDKIINIKSNKDIETLKAYIPFIDDEIYDTLKLWKPSYNEYCKFWNDNSDSFRVAKFHSMSKSKIGLFKDMQGNYFQNCEPYTGDFPTLNK